MSYFGEKIKSLPRFGRKSKSKEASPLGSSIKIGYPTLLVVPQGAHDNADYWMQESRRTLQEITRNMASLTNCEAIAEVDSDPEPALAEEVAGPEKSPEPVSKPLRRFRGKPKKKGKKGKKSRRKRSSSRVSNSGTSGESSSAHSPAPELCHTEVSAGKEEGDQKGKVVPVPRTPGVLPKTSVPKALVPKDSVPKTPVPKDSVPKTPVPKASVPKTSVPKTPVPKASVPKTPVPKDSVPKTPVPKDSVPEPYEFRFMELETHFVTKLSRTDEPEVYPGPKGGVRRINSITCSIPDHNNRAPGRPISSANSSGDVDSILVCYIEPEERFSCMEDDASDFEMTTLGVKRIDVFKTLGMTPATAEAFEGSIFRTPELKTPESETGQCEPIFEPPIATKTQSRGDYIPPRATGLQSPHRLSMEVSRSVVSVQKSRTTYPQGPLKCTGDRQRRESSDLKSLLSIWSSRECLINLCGISFESSLLASPRASLRLDLPDAVENTLGLLDQDAFFAKSCPPQIGLPPICQLPTPDIWESDLAMADALDFPDCPTPDTPDFPFCAIPESPEPAKEKQAVTTKKEARSGSEKIRNDMEEIKNDMDQIRSDILKIKEDSDRRNELIKNSDELKKDSQVNGSDSENSNVCTKMDKPWWEFDSDDDDNEPEIPEAVEQSNLDANADDSDAESDNSDAESDASSDSEDETASHTKSIFRQGNSSSGEADLFSECFDRAECVADPESITCVEETCLYKLIFPEEKEAPVMFQSRGFMEEISSFVEKSNAEVSKYTEAKPKPKKKPKTEANDKQDSEPVEVPVPEDDGKTSMVDVKNAPRSEDEAGQDYIESCQQIFVNGASFWMQTELLLLQMEDALAIPLKEKKKHIKFEEDIDANCPQIRITCDKDDAGDEDSDETDVSKWDLRAAGPKSPVPKVRGCLKKESKLYVKQVGGCNSEKVGFKILTNLMENVENMGKKLSVTCKGRRARPTILATLKEFELILLNVKHFEVDVNYESIIRYIKRILRLRRKLGEILSLTCGLQTEYVLVAEAIQEDRACRHFDRAYWMQRLRRCVQSIRDSRKQLRKVKAEIHEILAEFTHKTMALFKQSRKILKMRDDLLAQYQSFILANHVSSDDLQSSLESLRTFKEFLALYSTICTDGFKRLLWDDINVLDKSRKIFENMNKHFGESIKRQQLTLRGLQRPNELCPTDHRSKYKFRREISLLKKQRHTRRRRATLDC